MEAVVERKNSTVIQHADAFNPFIEILNKKGLDASGVVKNYGGHVIVESIFKNVKLDEHGVSIGVRLSNNYANRSGRPIFRADGFGIRDVCDNGMILSGVVSTGVRQHNRIAQIERLVTEFVEQALGSLDKIKLVIETADAEQFTDVDEAKEIIYGEIDARDKTKSIVGLLEDKDLVTRYGVYNAITNYATHFANDERERSNLHRTAQKILIQPIEKLKRAPWKTR